MKQYDEKFKKKIIRFHLPVWGRLLKSSIIYEKNENVFYINLYNNRLKNYLSFSLF